MLISENITSAFIHQYPALACFVKDVLVFKLGNDGSSSTHPLHHFATGCPGIYIQNASSPLYLKFHDSLYPLPTAFLFGQNLQPKTTMLRRDSQVILVYLFPETLHVLFTLDPGAYLDELLDFKDLAESISKNIAKALSNERDTSGQLRIIGNYLEKQVLNATKVPSHDLNKALALLGRGISVSKVCKELHVSPRTLQRLFKEKVGIPPSLYASIIQFHKAIHVLKNHPSMRLSEMAHNLDYADQSHFNRRFKQFTGLTPCAYKNYIKNRQCYHVHYSSELPYISYVR